MEIYAIWVRDTMDGIWLHSALDASSVDEGLRDDFDRALEEVVEEHGSANVRAQRIVIPSNSVDELFGIPTVNVHTMEEKVKLIIEENGTQKIQAIKLVREMTGKGLKASKEVVDNFWSTGKVTL